MLDNQNDDEGASAPSTDTASPGLLGPNDHKRNIRTKTQIDAEWAEKQRNWLIEETAHQFFYGMIEKHGEAFARKCAVKLIEQLSELNNRYAVAMVEGKAIVLDMYASAPPPEDLANTYVQDATVVRAMPCFTEYDSLKKIYQTQTVQIHQTKPTRKNIAEVWLSWSGQNRFERGLIFAPGASQKDVGADRLNLFSGWGTPPTKGSMATPRTIYTEADRKADEAACSEFLHHVRVVLCDGDTALMNWVLYWMANIVQDPMHKAGSALVLAGVKGCGKSLVAEVLREIVGQKYFIRISKKEELVGNFNGHLAGSLVVNCEEATFGGDIQANNTLKDLITSDTLTVNEKFLPRFTMRSYGRYIFTTNSDYSHNTDESERRFLFLDCGSQFVGDTAYFERMMNQLRYEGGYQAFANLLFNMRCPDGVNLRKVPRTEAHTRLMLESLSVEERYFANALVTGENYPEEADYEEAEIFVSDVKARFNAYLDENGKCRSLKRTDASFVPRMMQKYWGVDPETRRLARRNGRNGKQEVAYLVQSLKHAQLQACQKPQDGGLGLPRDLFGLNDEE